MRLFLCRRDSLLLVVLLITLLGGIACFFWLKPQPQRHEWAATEADSCRFAVADTARRNYPRRYDRKRRYRYDGEGRQGYGGHTEKRRMSWSGSADRPFPRSAKFRTDTVLNLNTADTTLLQRVPGIGPYWARRIVDYRNRLGGFVSPAQLDEIDSSLIPCRRWFHVPAPTCRRLAVNRAAFHTLFRHPYLDYQQVCQVMDYRRRHGSLSSLSTLLMLPAFSPADTLRLKPYLSFEVVPKD
ncbi:MAG: ComEA family DNA-binding protein [Prevotella sp.]